MITKPQIIKIKTLFRSMGLDSAEMAYTHSDKRTTHISDFTGDEAKALIKFLVNETDTKSDDVRRQTMARKIISMAHELGWQTPSPLKGDKPKADMKRINNWCINYGYLHKPLNSYTYDELVPLVTQFENMYLKELRRV